MANKVRKKHFLSQPLKNANQGYSEISFHLLEWLFSKCQKVTNFGQDIENGKLLHTTSGNLNIGT